ncbi:MAG: HlyD family efflux transporter periplasmic adaptor subunit [Pirellulales bacterium]
MTHRFGLIFYLLACGLLASFGAVTLAQEPESDSSETATADEKDAGEKDPDEESEEKDTDDETPAKDGEAEDNKNEAEEPAADKPDEDKSEEEKEDKDATEDKKRETLKIEPKKFETEVEVDGVFVARKMSEVELRPEEWTSFEITEVVPHGTTVQEGQVLVKFDDEKLNETIADLEQEQRLSELALRKSEDELPRMEKSLAMELDDAQQTYTRALEDQEDYEEVDRAIEIKSAKHQLKSAERYLQYERDELDQLQKMYEADDLTEETEEIILTRQKAAVESAEFYVEQSKIYHDRSLNVHLPRQDVDRRERLEQAKIALERAKLAQQIDVPRARYELEKLKQDRVKSLERHSKLTKDKSLMELKSPAEGIVYYGSSVDGQWSDMAGMIAKLLPKNDAPVNTGLFTIVAPRPMYVLTTVDEKNRPDVKDGLAVEVKPVAEGDVEVIGKVAKISPIPVSSGKFALEIDLEEADLPEWLVPGMANKATISTYTKTDAIVVPKKAVHDEEDDDDKKFVWIVDEKDPKKPAEKRSVKLGKTKGDDVEVVEGLKADDVISLEDEAKKKEEEEKKSEAAD